MGTILYLELRRNLEDYWKKIVRQEQGAFVMESWFFDALHQVEYFDFNYWLSFCADVSVELKKQMCIFWFMYHPQELDAHL